MWPDGLDTKDGTVYMEIDNKKVKLKRIGPVRCEIKRGSREMTKLDQHEFFFNRNLIGFARKRLRSWRKSLWKVQSVGEFGLKPGVFFCNREAAIMWLKRNGGDFHQHFLNEKLVCTIDGYVYFYSRERNLMITAESKKTHAYAIRNN